jgi:dolichol-phosphate mannosyltransferase
MGQNDPADIPKLLAARDAAEAQVAPFAGWRVNRPGQRQQALGQPRANAIRACCATIRPDTGCGIKLFERSASSTCRTSTDTHRYRRR